MPMPVLAILVFSCVVASCLLVLRPVFGMQVDNYGVRIRPRKQKTTPLLRSQKIQSF
jgi:hypothetical protein